MKGMKIFAVVAVAAVLSVPSADAQMMKGEDCPMEMMGKGGKQKVMGQGMEMMCEKMGMMGGMGQGMGMMGKMGMRHMKGKHHFYLKYAEKLGLSDDQTEELRKIKSSFKKGYILDRAKLKVARIELEELLDSDRVDMKMVEKKVKEITALKGKLMLNWIKARVEAREVLTEEQREKARGLIRERREEYMMMREGGMMGGRGMMRGMGMMGPMDTGKEGDDDMSMEGMKMEEEGEGHSEHH